MSALGRNEESQKKTNESTDALWTIATTQDPGWYFHIKTVDCKAVCVCGQHCFILLCTDFIKAALGW